VTWNPDLGCCGQKSFARSTNGGQSFEAPIEVHPSPVNGTMAVGPDGEVYISGVGCASQGLQETFFVAKSEDAANGAVVPTFTTVEVDVDGRLLFRDPPNPAGFLGQVNVAVDHSSGPTRGNVYLLASVRPPLPASHLDPLDVHFVRSTDGGSTWTAPLRVNDDLPGQRAWHWFGALSVAPNGRIDAVWNDTRHSGQPNVSQLFYAYSTDAGSTWSDNVAVTPSWDSHVGWPQQQKIGDYYTMISDDLGSCVAYAATFNDEQDVYFVRLFPDCNENGIPDTSDVLSGTSDNCNGNIVPDECEADCNGNGVADDCDVASGTSDDKHRSGRMRSRL
jgi:hypothetical protein